MARSRTRSPVSRRKPAARHRSETPSPPRRNRSKQSPKRSDRRNSKDKSKGVGGRMSKSPIRSRPRSSSRDARPTASRLRSSPSKDVRPALASRLGKKERSPSRDRRTATTSRKRSESPEFVAKPRRQKRSESPQASKPPPRKYPNIKVTASASGDADMDVRIEGEVENLPIFRGPELDPASVKELKKIQIEIRRNIPEKSGRSRSPIRRNIADPEKLFVPRKPDEGRIGIFEREEIKYYFPDGEKKVSLIDRVLKQPETKAKERKVVQSRSRSRSPRDRDTRDRKQTVRENRDLRGRLDKPTTSVFNRDRLEPRNASGRFKDRVEEKPSIKSRLDQPSIKSRLDEKPSMKDRLGDRTNTESRDRNKSDFRDRNKSDVRNRVQSGNREDDDPDRVLSREELERERPQVKPWEINPEFVPKGRYYFEHDNREGATTSNFEGRGGRDGFSGSSRGFQTRGRGNFRGRDRDDNFRGRDSGGRRPFNKRSYGSRSSPEWQHDKFAEEVERYEEPTSTTNE